MQKYNNIITKNERQQMIILVIEMIIIKVGWSRLCETCVASKIVIKDFIIK